MIQVSIGQAICDIRDERGLKQHQVAHAADLEPAQLSHIANGRGNPAWGTLLRISAGLEVSLSELLARAEEIDAAHNGSP